MAFGSDRAANFVIKAKDAATGPLGKIGGAMSRLKSAAGTAFKAIAVGAVAAAGAIAGLTIAAIKGAIEDEKAQARLVATLRARGKATDENLAKVDAAIAAGQKLAITDDAVRASIETATQFTNNFSKALKIQKVAQDLAIAKGIDLERATKIAGQAFAGTGKGLKAYGIDLQKTVYWTETKEKKDRKGNATEEKIQKSRKETIKGMDALNLITEKYGGIAAEVAQTNAVKLEAAQIAINEAFESFGARFLPAVSVGLDFFTANVIPKVEEGLTFVGDKIFEVGEEISKPGGMLESVGKVGAEFIETLQPGLQVVADALGPFIQAVLDLAGALWGDGKGPLASAVKFIGEALNNLFKILGPILELLTAIITAITGVISGAQKLGSNPANNNGFQFSGGALNGSGNGFQYGGTSTGGAVTVRNNITFGNDAVSHIDTKLGQTYSYGGSRTNP